MKKLLSILIIGILINMTISCDHDENQKPLPENMKLYIGGIQNFQDFIPIVLFKDTITDKFYPSRNTIDRYNPNDITIVEKIDNGYIGTFESNKTILTFKIFETSFFKSDYTAVEFGGLYYIGSSAECGDYNSIQTPELFSVGVVDYDANNITLYSNNSSSLNLTSPFNINNNTLFINNIVDPIIISMYIETFNNYNTFKLSMETTLATQEINMIKLDY